MLARRNQLPGTIPAAEASQSTPGFLDKPGIAKLLTEQAECQRMIPGRMPVTPLDTLRHQADMPFDAFFSMARGTPKKLFRPIENLLQPLAVNALRAQVGGFRLFKDGSSVRHGDPQLSLDSVERAVKIDESRRPTSSSTTGHARPSLRMTTPLGYHGVRSPITGHAV